MKLLKRHWPTLLGAALGALGGYLYWYFVGCADGTCPITSSPLNSTLWGAVMGGLLLSMFEPKPPRKERKNGRPVGSGRPFLRLTTAIAPSRACNAPTKSGKRRMPR